MSKRKKDEKGNELELTDQELAELDKLSAEEASKEPQEGAAKPSGASEPARWGVCAVANCGRALGRPIDSGMRPECVVPEHH